MLQKIKRSVENFLYSYIDTLIIVAYLFVAFFTIGHLLVFAKFGLKGFLVLNLPFSFIGLIVCILISLQWKDIEKMKSKRYIGKLLERRDLEEKEKEKKNKK